MFKENTLQNFVSSVICNFLFHPHPLCLAWYV